ncbi:MAG: hypothetical protein HYR91_04605 [Flavobacteriia bacterium]|nr:hypothetical protein [Flavobacteriia bacterium]
MSTTTTDNLINLIHSLTKAEKRSFKLYATRNSSSQDELKFLQLFDYVDKVSNYTDENALIKLKEIKKTQLSNIKAHLYKQILTSLRLQHISHHIEIEVRELIDYATVLYQKAFYHQALKMLDKAKQLALKANSNILCLEIVEFEKVIESQYITRSIGTRSDELTHESTELQAHVVAAIDYSNLALQLYALYLKVGFSRDEKDYLFTREFFYSRLKPYRIEEMKFEEKMHLYNAFVWFYYMNQDFLMCYKYARLWVDLFVEYPDMKDSRKEMYLKGMHNLLNALFNLRSYKRFSEELEILSNYQFSSREQENEIMLHNLYLFSNRINKHYLEGTFTDGLKVVPEIIQYIEIYEQQLDAHRIMVFYYKIACLYFGSGDNKKAIFYLNKVIQFKEETLREDIQSFARILNLIAHFELGNDILVEYQIKSVYRFLIKMGDLHGVQREILSFLRLLPITDNNELIRAFKILHHKLVKLSLLPFEKRPFLYLDIISWLECKIENKSVQEVIQSKFNQELETGNKMYFPNEE